MTSTTTDDPTRRPPPRWLIPALVGTLVVLLVILLVVVFAGDDEAAAPVVTGAPDSTDAPAATDVPATDAPPVTDAPAVTDASAVTDPPAVTDAPQATEPPSSTAAPSGPLAAAVGTLAPTQASIARADGTVTVDGVSSCRVTAVVAFDVYSYLYTGGPLDEPHLLEISIDEGGDPFVTLSLPRGEFEGFNGQDFAAGSYWGAPLPPDASVLEPVDQLTLSPVGGLAEGDVNVSFTPAEDVEACAIGFVGQQWPFGPGEPPQILDQFDERLGGTSAFAVLAACDPDGINLLLSETGILSSFELDGDRLTTIQINPLADPPTYLSRFEPQANDVLVERQGGGGDVVYVTRVTEFEGPDRYLTWTQPPIGPSGGLPVISC